MYGDSSVHVIMSLCISLFPVRSCEISGMLGPDTAWPEDSVRRGDSGCPLPTPCEEEEEKMLSAVDGEPGLQSQLYFEG